MINFVEKYQARYLTASSEQWNGKNRFHVSNASGSAIIR